MMAAKVAAAGWVSNLVRSRKLSMWAQSRKKRHRGVPPPSRQLLWQRSPRPRQQRPARPLRPAHHRPQLQRNLRPTNLLPAVLTSRSRWSDVHSFRLIPPGSIQLGSVHLGSTQLGWLPPSPHRQHAPPSLAPSEERRRRSARRPTRTGPGHGLDGSDRRRSAPA